MEKQENVFLYVNQLLKITTLTDQLSRCKGFQELRDKIESEADLSQILTLVHLDEPNTNRKASSICLDWTLALCTQLIQLPSQFQPSVSQRKRAQSLFTLLVSLGIRPNLFPSLQISKCQVDGTDPGLKHRRLVASSVVLLHLAFSPYFGAGLMQRHLVDILAALYQLCHAPIRKVTLQIESESPFAISTKSIQNGDFDSFNYLFSCVRELEDKVLAVEDLTREMWADRQVLTVQLNRLQNNIYQPLLVQALLTLQNLNGKLKPVWLKSCCGKMLSSALLRQPSGLRNVLEGMLQDVPPVSLDVPDGMRSRCQAVAQLLSQTPEQCSSTEQYLAIIAPQVHQLLVSNDNSNEKCMSHVAIAFLGNLQSVQPNLAKEFLFKPLLKPFAQLLNEENLLQREDSILISSESLEKSIQTLHKIFDLCGHERISLVEPLLLPISKILLALASACGTSYLRKYTLDLLQTLLETLEIEDALLWLEDGLCITSLNYKFQRTSSGGMEAVEVDIIGKEQNLLEIEMHTETLWYLIEKLNPLQASFFTRLLEQLSNQRSLKKSLGCPIISLLLVERMGETIEPECLLKDVEKVVNTLKLTSCDWHHLQDLVDILEQISNLCSLPDGTKQVAKQLRITIATRGAVPQPKPDASASKGGKDSENFECAWRYFLDAEVPLKCHGLVLIRRLLLKADHETLKHKQIILETLQQEHLLHQDSCVYQLAIQALAVLARNCPKEVLTILTTLFTCPTNQLETRLKAAEALVQICRRNPDLLSLEDKKHLLVAFLNVSRESSPIMKTSALSCLSDICEVMRFAVCPYLQEVLICLVSYLCSNSDVDVKRAAAMAIAHLLRGLGKDIFQVLKEELRDVHRALLLARNTEIDESLILHLNLALEEIKESMKQSLQKSAALTKEIRILDPFE